MSTGDRDIDVQQEILALLSDIADSLRPRRRSSASHQQPLCRNAAWIYTHRSAAPSLETAGSFTCNVSAGSRCAIAIRTVNSCPPTR